MDTQLSCPARASVWRLLACLMVASWALLSASAWAQTGFTGGVDCHLTVDPGQPNTGSNFVTIQGAVDALPDPGPCVVTVKAGTYAERVNIVSKNSLATSESQRIVIRAEAPGSVTIDPSTLTGTSGSCGGQSNTAYGFCIASASATATTGFVTIAGFDVTGAARDGIALFSSSRAAYASHDITIDGNIIHENGTGGFGGISVGDAATRTWIVNNLIRHNSRHGISVAAGAGQTYIVNNTFVANGWSGVNRAASAPIALVNNLFVHNGSTAGGTGNCSCGLGQSGQGTASTMTLVNNMFYENGAGKPLASGVQNVNDIDDLGSMLNSSGPGADSGNYTTTGHASNSASVTTGIVACAFADCVDTHALEEIFAPPVGPVDGFVLNLDSPRSPAIDKGVNSFTSEGLEWVPATGNQRDFAPQDDFFGTVRPQDGDGDLVLTVDIGYHEAVPRFMDVIYHWSRPFVDTLVRWGITAGCGPNRFCPDVALTRAQMAIFLLRGMYGAGYVPPPATGAVFSDVPADAFAAAFIEELAFIGITAGCATGPNRYCPDEPVTREDMSMFLLRARHGSGYWPPDATGAWFWDVPKDYYCASWIEQLAFEGITAGCGGEAYCPDEPVTRGQVAVFFVRTFHLF